MRLREQVAVLTAIQKFVKERLDDLREEADEEIFDLYEKEGSEKVALILDGHKVGEYGINFTKEGYQVTDSASLLSFLEDYGLTFTRKKINENKLDELVLFLEDEAPEYLVEMTEPTPNWDKCIEYVGKKCMYLDSGIEIPGISYVDRKIKNTVVRGCKPEEVLPIARQLGGVDQLLLGSGE